MQVLVVFAHPGEARASIERLEAKEAAPNLYTFSGGEILITGMGPIMAAASVAQHAHLYDEIWNFGVAGALQAHLEVGQIVQISSVALYLPLLDAAPAHTQKLGAQVHPLLCIPCKGEALLTCLYPIWEHRLRDQLSETAALVDLEGYGMVQAAHAGGRPCRLWKLISDRAGSGGWSELGTRLPEFSEALAEALLQTLAQRFGHTSAPTSL